jgi:hypothetical protein
MHFSKKRTKLKTLESRGNFPKEIKEIGELGT